MSATSIDRASPASLVPPELLARADRILFITHLAIGDFTYLQSGLRALAEAYPHLRVHVFVDERRRTPDAALWPHLRKYALYDWLAACPWVDKVYDQTYSPAGLQASLGEARAQAYPIVAALTVIDCHRYAHMARSISPDGFVVGLNKPAERWVHVLSRRAGYRKLDASLPLYSAATRGDQHISDIYAGWFEGFFGVDVPPALRYPTLDIPATWRQWAQARLTQWGLVARQAQPQAPLVFINAWSKSPDRTWPFERVLALVRAMRTRARWRDAGFVINTVPEARADTERLLARMRDPALARVRLFSAEEHFFQLPAMMALCGLVVSVETAVMHLANAVQVPVIALMRRNHPEWVPIDRANSTVIMVDGDDDWVTAIGVEDVLAVLDRDERVERAEPAFGQAPRVASA